MTSKLAASIENYKELLKSLETGDQNDYGVGAGFLL